MQTNSLRIPHAAKWLGCYHPPGIWVSSPSRLHLSLRFFSDTSVHLVFLLFKTKLPNFVLLLLRKLLQSIKYLRHTCFLIYLSSFISHKGIDPVKLERIQLPAQHAEERNSYNHVLAEGLIRIMNHAAQPGLWWWGKSNKKCCSLASCLWRGSVCLFHEQ